MTEYDEKKNSVICEQCYDSTGISNTEVTFMKRVFSTAAPLVYNTMGSHIDKVGIRQPKEFFDDQLEQQRKATDRREQKELMRNPELRTNVNKKRKQMGMDPV